MPYKPSFGTLQGDAAAIEAPRPETPFRIAVLGDFSGRANCGALSPPEELAGRRPLKISRDLLDDVMAKLGTQLVLPVGEDDAVTLSFSSLDDFHPDPIHDRVERFADLYDADEKSAQMNELLHHPDFQALEAAWRGLDWFLRRAQKGGQVEVVLFDLALEELAADLNASEDLAASALYQLLIEKGVRGPRGQPWALLVGDYCFDLTGEHSQLLGRLARIARQTVAPFLATVHPRVLDQEFALDPDDALAWQALRQLPEAALLGLAVPRFLLRLPYGENTQTIDKFAYEEFAGLDWWPYLWGNPAFACASLLAQAFQKQGWALKPGAVLDLENMPIHVYTVDGEEEFTLAEAWLVKPMPERLVKQGFMPLLCARDRGAMQLVRFLALAQPDKNQGPVDLLGRWGQQGVGPLTRTAAPPAAKVALGIPGAAEPSTIAPAEPAAAEPPAAAEAEPPQAAPSPAAAAAPAEPAAEMDPELAALLNEVEGASTPEQTTDKPAEAAAPAAEEEMDPELAALLKQMEEPS